MTRVEYVLDSHVVHVTYVNDPTEVADRVATAA